MEIRKEVNGQEVTLHLGELTLKFNLLAEAPENPEIGKWYRVTAQGAQGGYDPIEVYGSAKRGSVNKLALIFDGGGVAWDEYMAARPQSVGARTNGDVYYSDNVGMLTDFAVTMGIQKPAEENPLRDWCMINFPYNTGDFHAGTGDFEITDLDGKPRIIHFHGYTNYRMIAEKAKEIFGFEPEELLVCGCSAGAFGTALLTDDAMDLFPSAKKCWCMPDSALMRFAGYPEVARNVWKAPTAIADCLVTDDIVLDSLLALKRKRGDQVQIMYISSTRDAALAEYVNYTGGLRPTRATKKLCDAYQAMLKDFVEKLKEADPTVAVYIFDSPAQLPEKEGEEPSNATQHTLLMHPTYYLIRSEGVSVPEWISGAFSGKLQDIGLQKLDM